ncbi:hypothetical protein R1flu_001259 [Riccia fluitans]|uniref:Uncharacterized protein n=1 Tax=Riccia fluitans TaxID=41844 RepID=A0ABD1Y3S2_9MARC
MAEKNIGETVGSGERQPGTVSSGQNVQLLDAEETEFELLHLNSRPQGSSETRHSDFAGETVQWRLPRLFVALRCRWCVNSMQGIAGPPSLLGSVGVRQQQGNSLCFQMEGKNFCGQRREKHRRTFGLVTKAGMRLDPGGGGGGEGGNGIGRVIVNLALAGGLTYLTVTGKLGWVFDTIISLWLLAVLLPIVGVIAFLWFAEREIITGACPTCGESFQVFEFVAKEEPQLCPYCTQPFKLENGRFIRDEPRFSSRKANSGPFSEGFKSPFSGGFGRDTTKSSRKDDSQDPGGVIVDVEAEVRDRD